MRLSYSKLETFERCPRSYYLKYIKNLGDSENFFSQYGTFTHSLIDKANRGLVKPNELIRIYTDEYENVITEPPPNIITDPDMKYFFAGYDYFSEFESVIPNSTVIESEKKHSIDLFGAEFIGIIDMVVLLENDKRAIVDHKSSYAKYFRGKHGAQKFKQLYIYAEMFREETGAYPDKLIVNCFREKQLVIQDFDKEAFTETMNWCESLIGDINSMHERCANDESQWPIMENKFWCTNICECRNSCEVMIT